MIKYKLLNPDLTTHGGFKWEVGKTYTIDKPGNELCSNQVFHCYESPATATIFNRRHANIQNPVCYSVEVGEIVADDGLKMGTKSMALIDPVDLPAFTKRQYRIFAIYCARYALNKAKLNIPEWDKWADLFLSGDAAAAYAADAYAAAAAAAYAADAADAAAYAAAYAAYAAAAAYAADAYAAADTAAYAAYAAADTAAYDAAYDAAAYAAADTAAAAAAYDAAADTAAYAEFAEQALKA